MKKKAKQTTEQIIKEIREGLDSVERMLYWMIDARKRFSIGNRVRLSPYGKRHLRLKKGATSGKVLEVDSCSVFVLVDGYKRPHGYFHGFWTR